LYDVPCIGNYTCKTCNKVSDKKFVAYCKKKIDLNYTFLYILQLHALREFQEFHAYLKIYNLFKIQIISENKVTNVTNDVPNKKINDDM